MFSAARPAWRDALRARLGPSALRPRLSPGVPLSWPSRGGPRSRRGDCLPSMIDARLRASVTRVSRCYTHVSCRILQVVVTRWTEPLPALHRRRGDWQTRTLTGPRGRRSALRHLCTILFPSTCRDRAHPVQRVSHDTKKAPAWAPLGSFRKCLRLEHPEPLVGFEPTTARLRIECSTPELQWRRS